MKYLFGTLNEDDQKFFDQKINNLDTNKNNILEILENQTDIIKNEFLKCYNTTNNLNEKIDFNTNLVYSQNALLQKAFIFDSIINRFLSDMETDQNLIINAIIFATEGQIHPKLLNHNSINNVLQNIKITDPIFKLPKFFKIPTSAEMPKKSKICAIKIYFSENKIKYIIDIPLLNQNTFTIQKLYAIPNNIKNSNFFTYIFPVYETIAINNDKDKYFTLDNNGFQKCILFRKDYICHFQPLYNINENSICEIKLLMNELTDLRTFNIQINKLSEPIFQKLEARNSWLYSTPKKRYHAHYKQK